MVYNERAVPRTAAVGPHGQNFLGKVRVPAAGVPTLGEEAVSQLFTLKKRDLFSHICGEITWKRDRGRKLGEH
jgi:hypothetical protein